MCTCVVVAFGFLSDLVVCVISWVRVVPVCVCVCDVGFKVVPVCVCV